MIGVCYNGTLPLPSTVAKVCDAYMEFDLYQDAVISAIVGALVLKRHYNCSPISLFCKVRLGPCLLIENNNLSAHNRKVTCTSPKVKYVCKY